MTLFESLDPVVENQPNIGAELTTSWVYTFDSENPTVASSDTDAVVEALSLASASEEDDSSDSTDEDSATTELTNRISVTACPNLL